MYMAVTTVGGRVYINFTASTWGRTGWLEQNIRIEIGFARSHQHTEDHLEGDSSAVRDCYRCELAPVWLSFGAYNAGWGVFGFICRVSLSFAGSGDVAVLWPGQKKSVPKAAFGPGTIKMGNSWAWRFNIMGSGLAKAAINRYRKPAHIVDDRNCLADHNGITCGLRHCDRVQ